MGFDFRTCSQDEANEIIQAVLCELKKAHSMWPKVAVDYDARTAQILQPGAPHADGAVHEFEVLRMRDDWALQYVATVLGLNYPPFRIDMMCACGRDGKRYYSLDMQRRCAQCREGGE